MGASARALRAMGANAVVFSEKAWAVARKSAPNPSPDLWHVDSGSWRHGAVSSERLTEWVDDWTRLVPVRIENADDLREQILGVLKSGEYYVSHGEPDEEAQTDAIMKIVTATCLDAQP